MRFLVGGSPMQTILLLLLIYPIMIYLSFTSSLGARLFIAVVDGLVPDPVPFADEILTCTGVIVKIIKITLKIFSHLKLKKLQQKRKK